MPIESRNLESLTLFTAILTTCLCNVDTTERVLLVSFDGFRWNYLNGRAKTPHFDYVKKNGVHAKKGIRNTFITDTFPNHYSIATGLYEESHGIVGNRMFDKNLNETFDVINKKDTISSKWFDNGGEPIWVTNQRQSTTHRSGIFYWPGDGAPVKGFLPYRYLMYDPTVSNITRIDTVMSWFEDKYPINLGLLYFEEPDGYGHEFGPESKEMTEMIAGLDTVLGHLLEKIKQSKLEINIIITSDHGMATTPEEKVINLDDYIDPNSYRIFSSNPIGSVLPNSEEILEEICTNLSKVDHLKVYRKADIPERFHFQHNVRIQPLLIVTEEGYSLKHNGSATEKGNHGYDNDLPDMHPFFLAMGPAFKKKASVETFNNVDIYPLICHILGLDPAPNNGSINNVKFLLRKWEEDNEEKNSVFFIFVGILLFGACVAGVFSIAACRQQIFHRRNRKFQLRSLTTMTTTLQYPKSTVNGGHVPLLMSTDTEDEF